MHLLLAIQDKGRTLDAGKNIMKPHGCAVDTYMVPLFMGGSIPSSETSGSRSSQITLIEQSDLTSYS